MSEPKKMGRPPKPINWDKVTKQLEAGVSITTIAYQSNVDMDTLYNRFLKEFNMTLSEYSAKARAAGKDDIRYVQHMKALSGDVKMLIHLGKCRLGQKEAKDESNTINLADLAALLAQNKVYQEPIDTYDDEEYEDD